MKQLHTLEEVTQAFLGYSPKNMTGHYKLERMIKLLEFLGNPQNNLKFVHIAGTSGKTSTSYFIRGMLQAAGRRTGLTISPHITAVNERIQIDGEPLQEIIFLEYANRFMQLISTFSLKPTYFELLVALAYWVFAREKVDYVVAETGMGGKLDATNTIDRPDKVCVITDIGLDHVEILGDTLEKIARQKAGIIQTNNHVIVQHQDDYVIRVILEVAQTKQASLETVSSDDAPDILPGFQRRNWALAYAAYSYLKTRGGLPGLTVDDFAKVALQTPPGRWELYHYNGKDIILDGAHNPQKMTGFCKALNAKNITECAVMANFTEAPAEKIKDLLELLKPFTNHLIIPEFQAGQDLKLRRSLPAIELQNYTQAQGYASTEIQPDLLRALNSLLNRPEKTLIITGSLYLVSAVRPLLTSYGVESSTHLREF